MAAHIENDSNQWPCRLYDDAHPDNPAASCLFRSYLDQGWMSSIYGARFHDLIKGQFPALMAQMRVVNLQGYVTPAHARLFRMKHKDCRFQVTHSAIWNGHRLDWLVLTLP